MKKLVLPLLLLTAAPAAAGVVYVPLPGHETIGDAALEPRILVSNRGAAPQSFKTLFLPQDSDGTAQGDGEPTTIAAGLTIELTTSGADRGLAQLADNVRDGNFSVADLQGSTFTISNLGAIGGTYSTPIINTPEVAILLVGRSRKLPVVLQDDRIEPRLMMPLSLAYDHRLVDGATAARFLNEVIDLLEAPSRLLLAP